MQVPVTSLRRSSVLLPQTWTRGIALLCHRGVERVREDECK